MDEGQQYDVLLIEERRDDETSIWTAEHPELAGCNATGRDESEALGNLETARAVWMKAAVELGTPVPPGSDQDAVITVKMSRPWPVDPEATIARSEGYEFEFAQELAFAAAR